MHFPSLLDQFKWWSCGIFHLSLNIHRPEACIIAQAKIPFLVELEAIFCVFPYGSNGFIECIFIHSSINLNNGSVRTFIYIWTLLEINALSLLKLRFNFWWNWNPISAFSPILGYWLHQVYFLTQLDQLKWWSCGTFYLSLNVNSTQGSIIAHA